MADYMICYFFIQYLKKYLSNNKVRCIIGEVECEEWGERSEREDY